MISPNKKKKSAHTYESMSVHLSVKEKMVSQLLISPEIDETEVNGELEAIDDEIDKYLLGKVDEDGEDVFDALVESPEKVKKAKKKRSANTKLRVQDQLEQY